MKYAKYTKPAHAELEREVIERWNRDNTFNASVESRTGAEQFVFYDGPPFLTGIPHAGHLLISAVKDTFGRYKTMKGLQVERTWGWDCHGLPAEVYVEKALGIKNKKEIGTKISIPDYVKACRESMVKTGTEWEDTVDRIGRWVEFKGAYQTMDPEYMESVWWAFKELYEKGKIYDGVKVLVYCTKDATPISKSEVAMENSYQTVTDPSVFVYLDLEDSDEKLLAWTTTPWTLPANVAAAVNEHEEYSLVGHNGCKFYVASDAVERVMTDEKHLPLEYEVIKQIKGSELVGKRYKPLFENHGPSGHKVLAADFVTTTDGTGIVHEAPAYGEEDYELCAKEGVPSVSVVDANGHYTAGHWLGENIWEVNKQIAKTLVEEGKALKVEYIQHEYPHCHRCGTKLMYRAHPSWFMDIQGQKREMIEATNVTSWMPKHMQTGRFQNILDSAPDWNLSRDRFWATPIPVWKGEKLDGSTEVKVFGSYAEFEEFTGQKLDDYHLPQVMDVTFELDGVTMHHIGKVLDCWFESGSMPFAQYHYPFENKDKFESRFPADFIIEAIDQTRGWFYALTSVNVGLFGKAPYRNLITTGFIVGEDGKKLSKKLGNYVDPGELMEKYSADAFRLLVMSSPLGHGEDYALKEKDMADVQRKLNTLRSTLEFFALYAEADGWESTEASEAHPDSSNVLDIWILSRLEQVRSQVEERLNNYDLPNATRCIPEFIDDLSNWYVRRSRKRFWKSDSDKDKLSAYHTLFFVLQQASKIMAPVTPFIAEEIWGVLHGAGSSVHLQDWPEGQSQDYELIEQMSKTRKIVTEGLATRARNQIKVRQPLASLTVKGIEEMPSELKEIISEEMNVKKVMFEESEEYSLTLDTEITDELAAEGFVREFVRQVQQARKQADYEVSDTIDLKISCDDKWATGAIELHSEYISTEVLAESLDFGAVDAELVTIQDRSLAFEVHKVA